MGDELQDNHAHQDVLFWLNEECYLLVEPEHKHREWLHANRVCFTKGLQVDQPRWYEC